jgi:Sec-independent protein translocase protein TatA
MNISLSQLLLLLIIALLFFGDFSYIQKKLAKIIKQSDVNDRKKGS